MYVDEAQFDRFAQFVTDHVARFVVAIDDLTRRQQALQEQQENTQRELRNAIRIGTRWIRRLAEAQQATEHSLDRLAAAQEVTERKLQALIHFLLKGTNGRPDTSVT